MGCWLLVTVHLIDVECGVNCIPGGVMYGMLTVGNCVPD